MALAAIIASLLICSCLCSDLAAWESAVARYTRVHSVASDVLMRTSRAALNAVTAAAALNHVWKEADTRAINVAVPPLPAEAYSGQILPFASGATAEESSLASHLLALAATTNPPHTECTLTSREVHVLNTAAIRCRTALSAAEDAIDNLHTILAAFDARVALLNATLVQRPDVFSAPLAAQSWILACVGSLAAMAHAITFARDEMRRGALLEQDCRLWDALYCSAKNNVALSCSAGTKSTPMSSPGSASEGGAHVQKREEASDLDMEADVSLDTTLEIQTRTELEAVDRLHVACIAKLDSATAFQRVVHDTARKHMQLVHGRTILALRGFPSINSTTGLDNDVLETASSLLTLSSMVEINTQSLRAHKNRILATTRDASRANQNVGNAFRLRRAIAHMTNPSSTGNGYQASAPESAIPSPFHRPHNNFMAIMGVEHLPDARINTVDTVLPLQSAVDSAIAAVAAARGIPDQDLLKALGDAFSTFNAQLAAILHYGAYQMAFFSTAELLI